MTNDDVAGQDQPSTVTGGRASRRRPSTDALAWTFRPWTDSWIAPSDQFRVPAGAQKPPVWRAAFEAMEVPPPAIGAVFLHCDYLPVNLLWSRGKLTELTD